MKTSAINYNLIDYCLNLDGPYRIGLEDALNYICDKMDEQKLEDQNVRANLFLENVFEEGLNINRLDGEKVVIEGVEEDEWRQNEEVNEDRRRDENNIGREEAQEEYERRLVLNGDDEEEVVDAVHMDFYVVDEEFSGKDYVEDEEMLIEERSGYQDHG